MKNLIKKIARKMMSIWEANNRQNLRQNVKKAGEATQPKGKIRNKKTDTLTSQLGNLLSAHYEFRFNLITRQNEYRTVGEGMEHFTAVGQRELNTICIEMRQQGIDCWDRDLARYVNSSFIHSYHPFRLYMEELPAWDGVDRLNDLGQRVSSSDYWVVYFHRWMLAMAAQWMGMNREYANSMAPLLISKTQGWHKSTFCKSLLPGSLQAYYTDQINLSGSAMEGKLALMGLINLDEFDRLSSRQMAQLKNLMQMSVVNMRRAYQKNYQVLPRIASFIGTSNRKDLLTDPTGSRRFICIEVMHPIDCTHIDLTQIYAQLKAEILSGERYWFTSEEEAEIQKHNQPFYQSTPEEELFQTHFRAAGPDDTAELLSLADILETLRIHHKGMIRNLNLSRFGNALVVSGVERVHTKLGNRYRVVRLG